MNRGWTRREALLQLAYVGSSVRGFAQKEQTLPWPETGSSVSTADGVRFTDLSTLGGPIVSNDAFFVLQHGSIPELDRSAWQLSLSGELDRPFEIGLDELARLPRREAEVCFECAGNAGVGAQGLVGNARWGGVSLASVLERSGVRPGARDVEFYGADSAEERVRGNRYPSHFARSLSITDAFDENVLLAFEMNGEPLSVEHGAPVRLIVPGWYGIAQVKWLTRIEVLDRRFMGWYMAKDYVSVRGEPKGHGIEHRATSVGRQRLKSVVTRVSRADSLTVHGFAWNDGAPITKVEVAVDGDAFRASELDPPSSPHAWTPFRFAWRDARPGRHRLVSRATDKNGVQPTADDVMRYQATPWENNGQVVREIEIP